MQRAARQYPQSLRQEGRDPARRAHRRHHRSERERPQPLGSAQARVAAAAAFERDLDRARRHAVQQSRPSRTERAAAEGLVGRCRHRLILERPLERDAARRQRQCLHARCGRHGLGLLLGKRGAGVDGEHHAREREAERGLRRRDRARRRAALCHDRLWHGGRHRSRQRRDRVDQDGRRAGAQLADGGGRQGLLRFRRQRAACAERRRRRRAVDGARTSANRDTAQQCQPCGQRQHRRRAVPGRRRRRL